MRVHYMYLHLLSIALPRGCSERNSAAAAVEMMESGDSVRPVSGLNQVFRDRKSTRLNSSHSQISYAVFCLKKKNISHLISARLRGDLLRTRWRLPPL